MQTGATPSNPSTSGFYLISDYPMYNGIVAYLSKKEQGWSVELPPLRQLTRDLAKHRVREGLIVGTVNSPCSFLHDELSEDAFNSELIMNGRNQNRNQFGWRFEFILCYFFLIFVVVFVLFFSRFNLESVSQGYWLYWNWSFGKWRGSELNLIS